MEAAKAEKIKLQQYIAEVESGVIKSEVHLLSYIEIKKKGKPLDQISTLSMVYKLVGAPLSIGGFGSELHGQEDAGRSLASYVDYFQEVKKKHPTIVVKEHMQQPIILHGVGGGKSALLSNCLKLQQQFCTHPDIVEMLQPQNNPLSVLIGFNGSTAFNHLTEVNIGHSVIRRILTSTLGIPYRDACVLHLNSEITLTHCLNAILVYHRNVHSMASDRSVFLFLGVDEANCLVHQPRGAHEPPDVSLLKQLTLALQNVVEVPHSYVSSVFAGTHYSAITRSFLGTGIKPLILKITRLSQEKIESVLQHDAGVCDEYLRNATFQDLLRDVGPVMRAIGIIVSKLKFEYDEESIDDAKRAVKAYFNDATEILSTDNDKKAFYAVIITARLVRPNDYVSKGSCLTFDELQNSGTIDLIPSTLPDEVGMSAVSISKIQLDLILRHDHTDLADGIKTLFSLITTHSFDSFEKFVAHHHALKKAIYYDIYKKPVPLSEYFLGAWIGKDLKEVELQLNPVTKLPMYSNEGSQYPESGNDTEAEAHLKEGGVLLNAKGAAIDVISCEKHRKIGQGVWRDGVLAFVMKHTIDGDETLSADDINTDGEKALKALVSNLNYANADVAVIHISNEDLDKDVHLSKAKVNPDWTRSVVVHRGNIASVMGPLWGRMLIGKGMHRTARTFSTLAKVLRFK